VQFQVETKKKMEILDITEQLKRILPAQGEGALLVHIPHTTAAVTINEGADPDVGEDIVRHLERLAQGKYLHREGNGPAHLQASLIGPSVLVPFKGGKLELGTWQRIFFCEFDGPRTRRVQFRLLAGLENDEQ